jgi:hypothetical protein
MSMRKLLPTILVLVALLLPASGDYIVTVRPKTPPESPSLNFVITFSIK